ncbi:hypothetical protein B2G71_22205 [Novosphingobium sp. PC22D]|uniref:SGNH/GDSL hydrolase family protein n=1 Tax=Novosphingobium sp. PC22D TaxID=1962403 RepID=UPI000BFAF987|nr:GDSL-type esterase/lipase family protein [Novosphingobium sp. PC22D]PEQ10473.1 hypothetical protein B2G71_22205 [Novosphingobium sp. PC22D]
MGDSNVSGSKVGGPAVAFPAALEARLGHGISVDSLGRGGETAGERQSRPLRLGGAQLCILMYGTNDAAARGWLSSHDRVPIADFRDALTQIVAQCQEQSAQVLLLAAPPAGTAAIEARVAPYRVAMREVAIATGSRFRDPVEAFQTAKDRPMLTHDALHLTREAHRLLADWLALHLVAGS